GGGGGGGDGRRFSLSRRCGGAYHRGVIGLRDIVGQDRAVAQLARMVAPPRRPHAYLFAGPPGVGRRTTAEALAAMWLCRDREAGDTDALPAACGRCAGCTTMAAGTHPDYHFVYKELALHSEDQRTRDSKMQGLGIQVIREFLIAPAAQAATMGRGRVFVVREAEMMNREAQNALLKTLEEPPPDVKLILLARSERELLPTIRSRCALIRFGALPWSRVAERLIGDGVAPAEAQFWAAYTNGSLGEALRLAATDLYAFKCELVDRLAGLVESVDADLSDRLLAQSEAIGEAVVADNKRLAKTVATRRAGGLLLGLVASVYRDAMREAAGVAGRKVHADQAAAVGRIAGGFGPAAGRIVDQMARYEQLLWRNVNPKPFWDNVVLTCATAAPLDV
ncbi:MAG: ATP-binding protein, partial [Planctomycetota bacterium]